MASAKKKLRKSAEKFRRTEPALFTSISLTISHMAHYIKETGASEVVVEARNGKITNTYANDRG